MDTNFSLDQTLFWSFWANLLFIVGMSGYLLMDLLDYICPLALQSSISSSLYVLLASLFVINATLQLFLIYTMNRNDKGYLTLVCSSLLDKLGSYAYLLGAIFVAAGSVSTNLIWIFNIIGVCTFLIAATMNIITPATSYTSMWADHLNFIGSLFYLLAIVITRLPLTKIIVIFGDIVYLFCAILYIMCWCDDRKLIRSSQSERSLLVS